MIHFFDSLLQNELNDMSCLPQPHSLYCNKNLSSSSVKKSQTKIYEKIIKKKKKYLSKILLEKGNGKKIICSLDVSKSWERPKNASLTSEKSDFLNFLKENNDKVHKNNFKKCKSESATPSPSSTTTTTTTTTAEKPSSNVSLLSSSDCSISNKSVLSNVFCDSSLNTSEVSTLPGCSGLSKPCENVDDSFNEKDCDELMSENNYSTNLENSDSNDANLNNSSAHKERKKVFKRNQIKTSKFYRKPVKKRRTSFNETNFFLQKRN